MRFLVLMSSRLFFLMIFAHALNRYSWAWMADSDRLFHLILCSPASLSVTGLGFVAAFLSSFPNSLSSTRYPTALICSPNLPASRRPFFRLFSASCSSVPCRFRPSRLRETLDNEQPQRALDPNLYKVNSFRAILGMISLSEPICGLKLAQLKCYFVQMGTPLPKSCPA